MGAFDFLKKRQPQEAKHNPAAPAFVQLYQVGQAVPKTGINYKSFSEEGYKRNAWTFASIDVIARAAAGVPWIVYKRKNGGKDLEEIEDPNDGLVRLWRRPNPFSSTARFVSDIVRYYYISGNSYITTSDSTTGSRAGAVLEMWVQRPDRMSVLPHPLEIVAGYEYDSGSGSKVKFSRKQCLHFKTFNPLDDFYGLAPLNIAAKSIDLDNEADDWNIALLQNMCKPSGALSVKGFLPQDARSEMEKVLAEKYSGKEKAGRPMLLEGDMSWIQMSLSPVDMNWDGLKSTSRVQICSVLGVPPELVGDHENATYSNYQEARKGLYQETVLPLLDYLRDEFNAWLAPRFGPDYYLDYDRDEIEALQEDRSSVWKDVILAVKEGVISPNEGRDRMGYEKDTDPKSDKLREPQKAPKPGEEEVDEDGKPIKKPGGKKPPKEDEGEKGFFF